MKKYKIVCEVNMRIEIESEIYGGNLMRKNKKIIYCGRFDGEKCPYCGSPNTSYSEYHRDWVCHKCGKYFG